MRKVHLRKMNEIKTTMNKAENVPIATLSGIASLTEITIRNMDRSDYGNGAVTPELPLPASTCTQDIQLFPSPADANDSIRLVANESHSKQQIESFEKLLCSVNNAYLDFKNSTSNHPAIFTDIPDLPPIIKQVTRNRPDVFQPHFDSYHGSPLKTNNVSALAYSPNQRNTFIMQQQQQQQQQQHLVHHPSPLVQNSQYPYPNAVGQPVNHQAVNRQILHNSHTEAPFSPATINPEQILHNASGYDANNTKPMKINGQYSAEDFAQLGGIVPADMIAQNELQEDDMRLHKKRKKKHKQKRDRLDSDEINDMSDKNANSDLAIPKLMIRKVKKIQDDNEVEILEVARPAASLNQLNTGLNLVIKEEPLENIPQNNTNNSVSNLSLPIETNNQNIQSNFNMNQTNQTGVNSNSHVITKPNLTNMAHITSPSVVLNKLDENVIVKSINTQGSVETSSAQPKKRNREDLSSISSEEQTLGQIQKKRKPPGDEVSGGSGNQSSSRRKSQINYKDDSSGDSEAEALSAIKAKKHGGDPVSSSNGHKTKQNGDSGYEEPSSSSKRKVKSSRPHLKQISDDDDSSVPEVSRLSKSKGGAGGSKAKSSGDDEYDPGQGTSSGASVRKARRKQVNYREPGAVSEDYDSDESVRPVKHKNKKKKSRSRRKASSGSDDDFNPMEESAGRSEKSGKRLSKGANRSRLRSVSPDEDAAAWKAPALDPYWDEESEGDNEEMENLNKEMAAAGGKTETRKFLFLMEKILENEMELEADGNLDINEDIEIPPESLISRHLISALSTEVAKMKSSRKLSEMPADKLVRTIAIMDRHVKDSMQLVPLANMGEGEEGKRWFNIQMERVIRSAEASNIILHITTAPNMPKQVFLEEAIERVTMLCHFHLENTIYPSFDPIYKPAGEPECYSKKQKRSRFHGAKSKIAHKVYNKFCEVVSLLGNLLAQGSLTDSIILKMSQIGISPFFVEHVSVLQLEALKVSRAVFNNYVKHRDLILEDILASLSRLPSSKRNLRTYRLHGAEFIQMFTALVLQLIQCTVTIPTNTIKETTGEGKEKDSKNDAKADLDVLIVKSYEDALRAARNFLAVFLKKCSSSSRDENDYRPLFENFLHDLFTTANLPEWPASEVLLTQLGQLFVVTFSNTKLEMNLRTTALDYLSQIATHLRKAALKGEQEGEKDKLKTIIERLINQNDTEDVTIAEDLTEYDGKLRKALLLFLLSSSETDPSFRYAREFYLGQWIRDVQMDIEKSIVAPMVSIPGGAGKKSEEEEKEEQKKSEDMSVKLKLIREKKAFYHTLVDDLNYSTLKSANPLNYDYACTTIDHLAASRSFSQSFNLYMQQIFKMLNEQAIALRTKAVKALTMIVSVDPNILARDDVQSSVHGRLLDPSSNVREAAVDLIGQFVLKCPNLIKQYYEMIIARILDTGISVRKRVIKILQNICVEHTDFEKIPEICAKMIRRIEDETGIKKLVTEVFRAMWFQPVKDSSKQGDELYQKAVNITKVISMCKDTGFDWLETLLESLFDKTETTQASTTLAITACQQLVDCLFNRLLKPEIKSETNIVVSCLITLYLFCKASPTLLVRHAVTLQPYLSSKIETPTDSLIIQYVSKILEIVVPLMDHPNPKFLADLEEDSMKLMLKQSQNVVQSCTSCLASIINNVTHNFKFIVDGFSQFYKFLIFYKLEHIKDPDNPALKNKRPSLLRALFTIGLFCRHFDLDMHTLEDGESDEKEKFDKDKPRSEQVFDICMYFTDFADELITLKAILAIGFIGVRYPALLLKDACRNLYQEVLSPLSTSTKAKFTVLKSLQNHLIEEENRLQQADKTAKSKAKKDKETGEKEDIKEMGDTLSGTTSEIIQTLLKDIMKGFIHIEKQVRISALQVIAIILRQGLVHPAQCIPYLIAISTDPERLCQVKAEQCLNDLDSRYQGFIHMKAFDGVKMSYDIQAIIQQAQGTYVCAYRENENKVALLNHVYNLIRSNKQYRRPFLLSMLKQADNQRSAPDFRYYIIENLAYISYSTHEEPLFILYHIDKNASVSGANILQKFKELFRPSKKENGEDGEENNIEMESDSDSSDDEDDDEETLLDIQFDEEELKKLVKQSFGAMLMLELKKYLKTIYGFTDSKCQKYSPLEPTKTYERQLNRKCDLDFNSEHKEFMFSDVEKKKSLNYYLQFKRMMMALDKEQDDSDSDLDEKPEPKKKNETSAAVKSEEKSETAETTPVANGDNSSAETTSNSRATRNKETPSTLQLSDKQPIVVLSPTRSSSRRHQEKEKDEKSDKDDRQKDRDERKEKEREERKREERKEREREEKKAKEKEKIREEKKSRELSPSEFEWTIPLKIRLVEMVRECKLQSSRGTGSKLKKRLSDERPKFHWMTPESLLELAEQFETERVMDKRDSVSSSSSSSANRRASSRRSR